MIQKFKEFEIALDKLEKLDACSFSSADFKNVNTLLEADLNDISSYVNGDEIQKITDDEKHTLKVLITKIKNLEAKALHKSQLLSSFSVNTI